MAVDFELPPDLDLTTDDLVILPDEYRCELMDGELFLQQRAPLLDLAPLALFAALRVCCPPELRVEARLPLLMGGNRILTPDVVVRVPEHTVPGDRWSELRPRPCEEVALVVDVVRPDWGFADVFAQAQAYSTAKVPQYWLLEIDEWAGAGLTVLRPTGRGGFDVEPSTREPFATDLPFPVTVDLPALSTRWPVTFEYLGSGEEAQGASGWVEASPGKGRT